MGPSSQEAKPSEPDNTARAGLTTGSAGEVALEWEWEYGQVSTTYR